MLIDQTEENLNKKRDSSSSEELVNTSDEIMDPEGQDDQVEIDVRNFIVEN